MDESNQSDFYPKDYERLLEIFQLYGNALPRDESSRLEEMLRQLAEAKYEDLHGIAWNEVQKRRIAILDNARTKIWKNTNNRVAHRSSGTEWVAENGSSLNDSYADWLDFQGAEYYDEFYDWPELGPSDGSFASLYELEAFKYAKKHIVVNSAFYNVSLPVDYYRFAATTPKGVLQELGLQRALPETFKIATSPVAQHMHRHLVNETSSTKEVVEQRNGNRKRSYEVISRSDFPSNVDLDRDLSGEVLSKLATSILTQKKHGAGLLKVHLDLMNAAYYNGTSQPIIYDLTSALERFGYVRLKHGSFHTDVRHDLYARIVALASQWITVFESPTQRSSRVLNETPYWIVVLRQRLKEGDFGILEPLLATGRKPIITKLAITPGLWWDWVNMRDFYMPLPNELLTLQVGGQGHETERMALRLATLLAAWVRSSHKSHAGAERTYKIGTLIEAAQIETTLGFYAQDPVQSKRLRTYLAGQDLSSGAIGLLRTLGAFDLEIVDEEDFFAAGRGWKERLWNAHVAVRIPKLF